MTNSRTRSSAITAVSTAIVLGSAAFGFAALGATACGDDHHVAEARRALGAQLGGLPAGAAHGPGAQAASADDLTTARRYLEATLRLDPTNAAARAALAGLGPTPDVDPALLDVSTMPGPVAGRAPAGRIAHSLSRVAFGDVGAFGADVADAVRPWTRVLSAPAAPRTAADSAEALATLVGARSVAADSAARDSSVGPASRVEGRAETRARAAAVRRRAARRAASTLSAREDSVSRADSVLAAAVDTATVMAAPRTTHKRTWPWTRAQRWLVAKGLGGGAGAGIVVGAIVGNIPGALIAGSIGGGAVGFKKATQIGPAAPYPSVRDSAAFDAGKRERDRKSEADTTSRVAARP